MIKRFFYFLNACSLLGLLGACLACYISPVHASPLAFLGLGYPLIIVIIFMFLLLWAIWRDKFAMVNLLALLLSLPFSKTVIGIHKNPGDGAGIKVMSYNVRNFDLYNWSGNMKTRNSIMRLISQESPDIICFQEFYTDGGDFPNMEYLRDSLHYRYHYLHETTTLPYYDKQRKKSYHLGFGLAIFSRYEISDSGVVPFADDNDNRCIYANVKIQGKPLRIYTAHLQSVYLEEDDYDTIEELRTNKITSWRRITGILRKIRHAYTARCSQALAVQEHLAAYTGQKILCGDFNDPPASFTYHTISSSMQDAFVAHGWGLGKTLSSRFGIFRIDYILADPSIHLHSYRRIKRELSDHYPVIARFSL